ncbi:MAG: hypothetical protein GX083_05605 [Clostridiales bacterium]|nr:hypothetical protein [Clostridiales bacterium]
MSNYKRDKRILTALLVLILIIQSSFLVACGKKSLSQGEDREVRNKNPKAVIFVASDYQAEEGFATPSDTLKSILKSVQEDNKKPEQIILCGDYTNSAEFQDYQLSPENSVKEIQKTLRVVFPEISNEQILFVQGNHDALTKSIATSGLHEFDEYLVYVLNTQNDFPWKQGKGEGCLDKVRKTSQKMKGCFDKLIDEGETRPVIIAGHVPLHYTGRTSSLHTTGDNLYSSYIFDIVNDAGSSLDIIYLFGHNHSKGWDSYLGGASVYRAVGDTMLVPDFQETDITTDKFKAKKMKFTYFNAGYVGYFMNCSYVEVQNGTSSNYDTKDNNLTGTVIEIYEDKLIFSRYSADGIHDLGSKGSENPYRNDQSLISSKYYAKQTKSPQIIERK